MAQLLLRSVVIGVLFFGLFGCGDRPALSTAPQFNSTSEPVATEQLTEVATPSLITQLREDLAQYQPQVKILSPQPDELLNSSDVAVKLEVNDLPLFKDPDLGMGPHLNLFVDDQPYRAVYDVSEPIVLEDLTPGSHLLRVFASRPWHESFKNEGAYAETKFSIFTENNSRLPDFSQPLLTYSRPQGTFGAEPIMLDFYLTNAPLHFVAKENPEDNVADWRIRVTVNGESFIVDNWQPIYLKGFKKGENWLKLEFVDEQGELVENVYNNPVRVINYDPQVNDTLAKLVQNKLSLRNAKKIVTTKELPPQPEVEIIEPETALPEIIDEPAADIIELEDVNAEIEIIREKAERDLNDEAETFESDLEIGDRETPAIAPDETIDIESSEPAREQIEESLEEIQTGIEEIIDPNIENSEASEGFTENLAPELAPTQAEPIAPDEDSTDEDEKLPEMSEEIFEELESDRTTDIYEDEIKLEP